MIFEKHLKATLYFGLFTCIMAFALNAGAQKTNPRIKLGAYYFAGWSGKNALDD